MTYDGLRIQEVTIQRKRFFSAVTPFFDKVIHKLPTMKRSKTPKQYPVEVICTGVVYWQNVIPPPEFQEARGLGRSILLSLRQLKLIPEKVVVHLLLECY